MRYRDFLPQHFLFLDAQTTAVLPIVLGLTSLILIQALADSVFILGHKLAFNRLGPAMCGQRSRLSAHLRRRNQAEAVHGYHRRPLGLPFAFSSLNSISVYAVLNLVAIVAVLGYFMRLDLPVPLTPVPLTGPIPIVAGVSGRVQRIYVSEGAQVSAGDVLIQLDARSLRIRKNAVESRIHLAETRATSSGFELASLYRELHQIQLDLGNYTITSPIDAFIVALVNLKTNDALLAGQAVAIAVPYTVATE